MAFKNINGHSAFTLQGRVALCLQEGHLAFTQPGPGELLLQTAPFFYFAVKTEHITENRTIAQQNRATRSNQTKHPFLL